jgi:hypothetical protein
MRRSRFTLPILCQLPFLLSDFWIYELVLVLSRNTPAWDLITTTTCIGYQPDFLQQIFTFTKGLTYDEGEKCIWSNQRASESRAHVEERRPPRRRNTLLAKHPHRLIKSVWYVVQIQRLLAKQHFIYLFCNRWSIFIIHRPICEVSMS